MSKLLNIALLAATATAALHVKNAAGELMYADEERKLPVRIHLHGPGSEIAGVVESRQTARSLKRYQDNDGKLTAASPEERRADTVADLTTLTARFENFHFQPDGAAEPLAGEQLCHAIYGDPAFGFITKQVTKHFGDWGNFSAVSTTA